MNEEFNGYVIYNEKNGKKIPYAVIGESYECQALATRIPKVAKDFIVPIEDKRFYSHNGIDVRAILRSVYKNVIAGRIVEGGSTISQQLARNLIRNNSKTFSRKLREIYKAIQLESKLSKDEILDEYFNNVYFGGNLRGLRTASLNYFAKEPNRLNTSELLYLLTLLRGPNYYLASRELALNRYRHLNRILLEKKTISRKQYTKAFQKKILIKDKALFSIKNIVANHIIENIDRNTNSITSTIDITLQNHISQFVKKSKYPVSVIAIRKGKVVGVSSSYGSDYPFVSKTNVGSTLKPFIYCFARQNGIALGNLYNAQTNNLDWNVREVSYANRQLDLKRALLNSNNNAFVNIAEELGIENVLSYLATLFNQTKDNFLPSSILGATKSGISLFELSSTYDHFFSSKEDVYKSECTELLNKIFISKTGLRVSNVLLKTGTTNNNKERIAVLRAAETTFALLRNENEVDDLTKEGGFVQNIINFITPILKPSKDYRWR